MQRSRKFSQPTHPIHPIGPQTHVLGCFGMIHYYTNFGAKWAELEHLMHKFVQRSCVQIFRNERTRSIILDPNLKFWGVSDCFITARTAVQNRPNWCLECTSLCNEVAMELFATSAPDPPHWTPNSYFGAFKSASLLHKLV
jgi:hypothetical protein